MSGGRLPVLCGADIQGDCAQMSAAVGFRLSTFTEQVGNATNRFIMNVKA